MLKVIAHQGNHLIDADAFHMHDDGDLTLKRDGGIVAGFARGQWVACIEVKEPVE